MPGKKQKGMLALPLTRPEILRSGVSLLLAGKRCAFRLTRLTPWTT
jgi:hypothetical protein